MILRAMSRRFSSRSVYLPGRICWGRATVGGAGRDVKGIGVGGAIGGGVRLGMADCFGAGWAKYCFYIEKISFY